MDESLERGVTREAVKSGFENFVDEAITITSREFSVARAMRQGVNGPGGSLVDKLLKDSETLDRRVVQPELQTYRQQTLNQFDLLLDYVESGEAFDAHRDRLLEADAFVDAIDDSVSPTRREELQDILAQRQRDLGDAVAPLVESSETEFWDAVTATLTPEQAQSLVEDHFAFTWPIRENRRDFELSTSFEPKEILGGIGGLLGGGLPTVTVAYTDEALRAMGRAEQKVIKDAHDEIRRQF